MKKMILALLLVFSLFATSSVKASAQTAAAQKTVIAKENAKPFSGHWEYWCVYNEKTGQFEIIAVWVEDDI